MVVAAPRVTPESVPEPVTLKSASMSSMSQKPAMSLASEPVADILVHFPASMATTPSVSSFDEPSLCARRNFSSYFI